RILFCLAAFLYCGGMFFVVLSARDLQRSAAASPSLYCKRIVGLGVQGDLLYATQESRRMFLYAFPTDSLQYHMANVQHVRKADLSVDLLTGKSMILRLDPEEERMMHDFAQKWMEYLSAREDVIALVLAKRKAEALELERMRVSNSFDEAQSAIAGLKL